MKKIIFLAFLAFFMRMNAQVGIGTTAPNGALDVESTTDGLLIPRVALSATNTATVATPTESELVYNTATSAVGPNQVTPGFYYWNGILWVRVATGANNDWALTGNSGTVAGTNFVGTTDAQDLRIKTGGADRLNISNTNGQLQSYFAGTNAAPAFSWNADPDTGIYEGGANVLGFSTNGIERAKMNTTEMVVNDASNNYDFRIETDNNQYGMFSDASQDAVMFGSVGNLYNDATTFTTARIPTYTSTVNYVADFDAGTSRGTTMGLGSIEYLVDGEAELFISDSFAPVTHLTYDLGYSNAWRNIYAQTYFTVSDIRAKENIKPLKYGLDEIMQLSTISYTLKKDKFKTPTIGVIAQEVNRLIKEATITETYKKKEDGTFEKVQLNEISVSYDALIPVLIKATQEQQAIIEVQNKRIEKLEKAVEQLLNKQ